MTELIDGRVIQITPVDKRLDFFEESVAQIARAGDGAGLDQGGALPALAPGFVIEHRRVDRLHQRSVGTQGAEPQVDAKNKPVFGDLAHGLDDSFADFGEKLTGRCFAFGSAGAFALIALKKKNNIDVGAEIQLAASQFAHAKDDEAVGLIRSGKRQRAIKFLHFDSTETVGGLQRRFGKRRQLAHGFFHLHARRQIARADAQVLPLLVPSQSRAELIEGRRIALQRRRVLPCVPRRTSIAFEFAAKIARASYVPRV